MSFQKSSFNNGDGTGCARWKDYRSCCRSVEEQVENLLACLPCHAGGDYPEPEITRKNLEYARKLLDAYANGDAAEMTAIAQYIHHHITIGPEDVSNLELCIALVEMKHLELLGTMIEQLGLDPKYWRGNKAYWSGGNVAYGTDLCNRLRLDIEGEKAAINAYQRLIDEIDDPEVLRVLRRILADEKMHLRLFKEAWHEYCDCC